ncbi:MAG: lactate utilization protein [Chloroflexota bacterium]|nr:MAG: lactate utilization protein [Chloroflexota bacterium]
MAAAKKELVEKFKAEASRAGALVHEAVDAKDANNYVLKLAQERNVKHAVKSKSKVADKLNLRERLEKADIEVKETTLEEWITQLAGKKQAGRKTIKQMAELISKATGKKLNHDPQVLLNSANRAIKQSCIDADMGISEASVAIAETGTLVITSNSGDSRLVAVLPRIHLTVVDCENIVPTLEDAAARIKPLGKNKADGYISSYVTYITGRNTTADIPGAILARAQGPAEEHILLLNGATSNRGAA